MVAIWAAGIYNGGARWLEIVREAPQLQARYAWSLIDSYVTDPTWTRDWLSRALETATPKPRPDIRDLLIFPEGRAVTVDTIVIAGLISVKLSWYDPTIGRYGNHI